MHLPMWEAKWTSNIVSSMWSELTHHCSISELQLREDKIIEQDEGEK